MGEFKAIYRCRLCGEKYMTTKLCSVTGRMRGINFKENIIYTTDGEWDFHKYEEHSCGDGSIGLADFQGFRKVKE